MLFLSILHVSNIHNIQHISKWKEVTLTSWLFIWARVSFRVTHRVGIAGFHK